MGTSRAFLVGGEEMALRIAQLAARSPKGWHVLDASNASLGRVAAQAATLLTGKHKAVYHPSAECGDYVVVVNVDDAAVTDKKLDTKVYRWHTQYAGGAEGGLDALAVGQAAPGRPPLCRVGHAPQEQEQEACKQKPLCLPRQRPPLCRRNRTVGGRVCRQRRLGRPC